MIAAANNSNQRFAEQSDRQVGNYAEQAVICSMIIDGDCIPDVLAAVRASDFSDPAHALIFRAIKKRHRLGQPIDVLVLLADLKGNRVLGENPQGLLADIGESIGTIAHAVYYAGIVRDNSRLRSLVDCLEITKQGAAAGKPPDELIANLHSELEDQVCRDEQHGVTFQRLTCRELVAGDFEMKYLIEGALVAGQPLILAGPPKSCKTTLIIEAATSLASATPMLDRLRVPEKVRVGVMTGESGMATIRETAQRVATSKDLKLDKIEELVWSPDVPRFNNPQHLDALRRFIEDDGLQVIAIDPAYLCMPGADAGNLMVQGELLRSIATVCEDAGATLILAHHTNKQAMGRGGEPLELDDIAWAGFKEFARQWWLISRREKYEPGSGSHKLWLSIGGSAGHSALWAIDADEGVASDCRRRGWAVQVKSGTQARESDASARRQAAKASAKQKSDAQGLVDREAVIKAMSELGGTETLSIIAKSSRRSHDRTRLALKNLVSSGEVRLGKVVKDNGRSYDGYELCKK